MNVQVMVTHNRLPFVYDKSRPARFGFLPKRPKSGKEVVWLELPAGEDIALYLATFLSACFCVPGMRVLYF